MNTKQLEVMIEVAKQGSFAKAAEELDLDPSVVSRMVANLERQLKVKIFQRSTRTLTITEAGSRYIARMKPVLMEILSAQDEIQSLAQKPSGAIKITASTAFGQEVLLPIVNRFLTQYPEIEIELLLSDENLDLIQNDIDIAFRLAPAFDSSLIGYKLFDTHYGVYASKAYLDNNTPLQYPSELAAHQCLTLNLPKFKTRWLFQTRNNLEEVSIRSQLRVSNALALRRCAELGMGPALLADWLVKEHVGKGTLIRLFPAYSATATDFQTAAWLLYPSRDFLPLKTRTFIDFIKLHTRKIQA